MTGNELIAFIKENNLEDSEVCFSEGSQNELVFGRWGVKDGGEHDEVLYLIQEEGHKKTESCILQFTLKNELDADYTKVTSKQGIDIRIDKEA